MALDRVIAASMAAQPTRLPVSATGSAFGMQNGNPNRLVTYQLAATAMLNASMAVYSFSSLVEKRWVP